MSPEATDIAVDVGDLVKQFGAFTAVDHVSFAVLRGEVFGFLGPNGAGKSTTIRMLCGLLLPTSGRASVGGFDVYTQSEALKAHIGYMSQKFSLYNDLTVSENIRFYGGLYGLSGERLRERMEWALEMAGLEARRDAPTRLLAGGWKQRLALGCAVLHEPSILFLDEPTSGVDPISRRRFWDLIYEMAGRGVTVFVTTHYMEEAEYCDRLALIYRGRRIALGSPAELKGEWIADRILHIAAEPLMEAVGVLDGLPGLRDVALFGNRLHATVPRESSPEEAIRRALESRGISLSRIEEGVPVLEDVFVSLIERENREAQ